METRNLIGGAWLATHHGLNLVTHLAVQSRIGGRRKTELADGVAIETFVEAMRPAPGLRGRLLQPSGAAQRLARQLTDHRTNTEVPLAGKNACGIEHIVIQLERGAHQTSHI
jgi:hypothetical protein